MECFEQRDEEGNIIKDKNVKSKVYMFANLIDEIKYLHTIVNDDYKYTYASERSQRNLGRLNVLGEMKDRLEGILERHS